VFFSCFSQTQIDSLKEVSVTLIGIERVEALSSIARLYQKENIDSSQKYSRKVIRLAEEIKYPKGIILGKHVFALSKVRVRELDTALILMTEVVDNCKEYNYTDELNRAYNTKGFVYNKLRMSDSALSAYKKAIKYSKEKEPIDSVLIAYINNNIGLIYLDNDNYISALEHFILCRDYLERLKKYEWLTSPLSNIALIYTKLENYNDALEYYRKALHLAQKHEMGTYNTIQGQNYIAVVYKNLHNTDSAKYYYNLSLSQAEKSKNNYLIIHTLVGMSDLYISNRQYSEAENIILRAKKIADTQEKDFYAPKIYMQLTNLYAEQNNYKKALEYNNIVFSYYNSLTLSEKILCNKVFYKSYIDDKQKAFPYLLKVNELTDSLNKQEKLRTVNNLESKYILKNKEKHINQLETENRFHIKSIERNRIIFTLLIITAILLLLVIFIINAGKKRRKKLYEKIENDKELISNQKISLERIVEKLEKANNTKDKFFSIIAHDLRNPFGAITSATKLLAEQNRLMPREVLDKLIQELYHTSENTSALLENLLSWALSQKGEIKIEHQQINLLNLVSQSVEPLFITAQQKHIEIVFDIPEDIFITADLNTMKIVVSNIVSNSIKFTRSNGKVKISGVENSKQTCIKISDTGVGMSEKVVENLFKINKTSSSKGTNNEKGTGLGLILCREFITKNNGTLKVKSTLDRGSEFIIVLNR
jgi:signal transduction histidine kinase/Flp pilus assembly protein TadD